MEPYPLPRPRYGRDDVHRDASLGTQVPPLTLGVATTSSFKDGDCCWDNTGKNAHYSPFE